MKLPLTLLLLLLFFYCNSSFAAVKSLNGTKKWKRIVVTLTTKTTSTTSRFHRNTTPPPTSTDSAGSNVQPKSDLWKWSRIVYVYLGTPVVAFGVIGCLLIIAVFSGKKRQFFATTVFIQSQAVANCLCLLIVLCLYYQVRAYSDFSIRNFSEYGCRMHTMATYWLTYASAMHFVLLALDRLLSVACPYFYRNKFTPGLATMLSITSYLLSFCFALPFHFIVTLEEGDHNADYTKARSDSRFGSTSDNKTEKVLVRRQLCHPDSEWANFFSNYLTVDIFIATIFPFSFVLLSTIILSILSWKQSKRLAEACYTNELKQQGRCQACLSKSSTQTTCLCIKAFSQNGTNGKCTCHDDLFHMLATAADDLRAVAGSSCLTVQPTRSSNNSRLTVPSGANSGSLSPLLSPEERRRRSSEALLAMRNLSNASSERGHCQLAKRLSRMLLAQNILFLVLSLPLSTYFIILNLPAELKQNLGIFQRPDIFLYVHPVFNLLQFASNAIQLPIFFIFNKAFRTEIKALLWDNSFGRCGLCYRRLKECLRRNCNDNKKPTPTIVVPDDAVPQEKSAEEMPIIRKFAKNPATNRIVISVSYSADNNTTSEKFSTSSNSCNIIRKSNANCSDDEEDSSSSSSDNNGVPRYCYLPVAGINHKRDLSPAISSTNSSSAISSHSGIIAH